MTSQASGEDADSYLVYACLVPVVTSNMSHCWLQEVCLAKIASVLQK